jgi:hypothetical protein
MSEHLLLGNTLVRVHDDRFARSYQEGYLSFKVDGATTALNEGHIYTVLSAALLNTSHLPREQAGFVVGWVAALLETPSTRHKELVALVGTIPKLPEQRASVPLSALSALDPDSIKFYGG